VGGRRRGFVSHHEEMAEVHDSLKLKGRSPKVHNMTEVIKRLSPVNGNVDSGR